jgi:protein TonB
MDIDFHDRSSRPLLYAVLGSLALHAAAGGFAPGHWKREQVMPQPPLTVILESLPQAIPAKLAESAPPVRHKPSPSPRSDTPPVHESKLARLTATEPVEAPRVIAAAPSAPAVESMPVPVPVISAPAKAQATTVAKAAAADDIVEPPHFNVAYLNNPRPAYPLAARRLGIEGVVLLRVQVSSAGAPEQVDISRSSGAQVLDEAALKAVQGWSFVPAKRGNTAVAHWVEVPIRFQLKN